MKKNDVREKIGLCNITTHVQLNNKKLESVDDLLLVLRHLLKDKHLNNIVSIHIDFDGIKIEEVKKNDTDTS